MGSGRFCLSEQMFQKDLDTDENEHDAAGDLGALAVSRAGFASELHADRAQDKGDGGNYSGAEQKAVGWREKIGACHCHRDTDRHRVNAGGDRHYE